jgi:predicted NBD/HSP70 family sugar kinase
VGHIPITEGGVKCNYGHSGCLESLINLNALASLMGKETLDDTQLAELPVSVAEAAKKGDEIAIKAIDTIIHYLTRGVMAIVNIFNPKLLMLGGAMQPVFEYYTIERIGHGISEGLVPGIVAPEISLSHLGLFECAIGAASIAPHKAFDLSNIDLSER